MKKILYLIQTIVVAFLLFSVISTAYENIDIKIQINNFMEKGVYCPDLSTNVRKFYKVPRETWQEAKPAYHMKKNVIYPGSSGDIIVALESPFPDTPIIDEFITWFFGGHASLCAYDFEDFEELILSSDAIENTGLENNEFGTLVTTTDNAFWSDSGYKNTYFGLRVNCTEEQRKMAVNNAISCIGDPYNYSFIFNTKRKHYCTDLVSKAYKKVGINLNKDLVATTVLDLMVTDNTYMSFYKYSDNNTVEYIYFLDDAL